jgi:hypothetical protein
VGCHTLLYLGRGSLAVGKYNFEIILILKEEQLLLLFFSCVGVKMNVCDLGRVKVIRVLMGKQKRCHLNEYCRCKIFVAKRGVVYV